MQAKARIFFFFRSSKSLSNAALRLPFNRLYFFKGFMAVTYRVLERHLYSFLYDTK